MTKFTARITKQLRVRPPRAPAVPVSIAALLRKPKKGKKTARGK